MSTPLPFPLWMLLNKLPPHRQTARPALNHYQVPLGTITEMARLATMCSVHVRICIDRNQPTLAAANAFLACRLRARILEVLEALKIQ